MQFFPLPDRKLRFEQCLLSSLLENRGIFNSFPVYRIFLLIPGSEKLILCCKEILSSPENAYFMVKKITATTLIQKSFIDHFIKKGSLYAFSHGAKAEIDNFLTVSTGKLVLSLESDIAQSLSLIKRTPRHLKKKKKVKLSHEIYTIDMSSEEFNTRKKLYESTFFELDKLKHMTFDLFVKWDAEGNICSESIRSYFESQGFECTSYKPQYTHYSKFTVQIPKIDCCSLDPNMAEDILEWIGTEICGIEYSDGSNKFVSNFTLPEPSQTLQKLQIASFEGFYTGEKIISLLHELRKTFEADENLPFVAVLINGFQDCYISAKGCEKFSSAEKLICLMIFPNLNCWLISLNT